MRRFLAALAGTLAVSMLIAVACNPIFGIVERTEGPTWCEQDAQVGSAYCDDFDRVSASTTAEEDPQMIPGATSVITNVVSSSPPNSLAFSSPGVAASHLLVTTLVSFGSSYSGTQAPFRCRIDLQPSELVALGDGAGDGGIGVVGLGGEVQGSALTEFLFVSVLPGGHLSAALGTVGGDSVPTPTGHRCAMLPSTTDMNQAWTTLQISMAPLSALEGHDAGASTCLLVDGGPSPTYVAVVQLGPFQTALLVPATLSGRPLFGYGLVANGPATPRMLHVDNAECATLPTDGGIGPP